ncbi:MAG TPA: glycosyltransferase [Bacteroidetes bacterium]|nr:glycosyltransferase [Bacteroidota bacterium]
MNLLFLNSARTWGGNEQWTLLAAKSLQSRCGVALAYRDPGVGERFPVPAYRLPFLNELDPWTLSRLVRIVHAFGIDVLIPTKRKDYVLAGLVARWTGRVNILRLGIVREPGKNPADRWVYGKLADGILVNAQSIRRVLLHAPFIRPERVRVVYNGVDVAEIQQMARKEQPEARLFPVQLVSVGLLSWRKGYDLLLRGFARALQRWPGPEKPGLVIVGDGPDAEAIRHLAQELKLGRHVRFLGARRNPFPVVAASDAFVLVSRNEGVPNAMLEAMALGKPVLVTAAGGTAEVIRQRQNGILVEPDEHALASSVLEVLQDVGLREKLGREAKQTVLKRFTLERMAEEILRFCEEVRWRRSAS